MSYTSITIREMINKLNRNTFLPDIQREYVWDTEAIEKLFDSIMSDYPISTFLFWEVEKKTKEKLELRAYKFIDNFNLRSPHNEDASINTGENIFLVIDGQQRLTSLMIGLKGSYEYFYYKKSRKTKLYLNVLKAPIKSENNPEELAYQFQFRENAEVNSKDPNPQFWYLVADILEHYNDAEEAKDAIEDKLELANLTKDEKKLANSCIGKLHSRINTMQVLNYYVEKSQEYDKVVEVFIRANTGGVKLEYSDILLSTATAQWKNLNAREEIHDFTDEINKIGEKYSFGKDFVLKGCLYLTEGLPIQYKVKNFTTSNLEKIENNWDNIKENIKTAIELVSKFGFYDKNLVSKAALLPIAYYLSKRKIKNFVSSSDSNDLKNQVIIQKWLVLALLKNAFGGSSDTVLKNIQDVIDEQMDFSYFPYDAVNKKLNIESSFNDIEIENLLSNNYNTKYSYLILSLFYPDRDWKDSSYHEDHIFPKSEFTTAKLKQRGYDQAKIDEYQKYFNCIINLQLLPSSVNLGKSADDFGTWVLSQDEQFKIRHTIPELSSYNFDNFLEFVEERKKLLSDKLRTIALD